jgi:hypothetical protein
MKHISRRWPLVGLLGAVLAIAALASVGCGSDKDSSSDGDVLNAITIIDKAGLHDLNTQIETNKTIPANATTTYQQLQTVTLLTEWPTSDLKTKGKELAAIFGEAAAAVDGTNPDIAKAVAASKKAHDGYHEFSHDVWDYLYGKAGVKGTDDAHSD